MFVIECLLCNELDIKYFFLSLSVLTAAVLYHRITEAMAGLNDLILTYFPISLNAHLFSEVYFPVLCSVLFKLIK